MARAAVNKKTGVTEKQEHFCHEIIKGASYSDAYRAAYNASRMKPETINRSATELANKPSIAARLEQLRVPVLEKATCDAAYVLKRLREIDELDVRQILNDDWTLKPLSEWPDAWCTFLSSIDVQEVRMGQQDPDAAMAFIKKIKWPDKVKNLELLGKHVAVQAFKENIEAKNTHLFEEIRVSYGD